MTSRRQVLTGLALGALLLPRTVNAQAPAGTRRVGLLMSTTRTTAAHIVAAFTEGLGEHGYVVGKNVAVEYRWAEGDAERIGELAADLVRLEMDVLVGSSQGAALALARSTKTIPIVMVNASDPVGVGLVASLARPGGNVTGLSQQLTPEIRAKQLQLLKEALPKLSRVAVPWNSSSAAALKEYESAGRSMGVHVQLVQLRGPDDLEHAFAAMATDAIDAVVVPGDTVLFMERTRVVELARKHRLPAMYSLTEFTAAGGLMSYSARLTEQFRRAAVYVDKILRGAAPATLPVEPPTEYELVVNLATAKVLGLTLPGSFLRRANYVIEH